MNLFNSFFMEDKDIMKRFFKVITVLFFTGMMAAAFISCSNASSGSDSSGGSGSADDIKQFIGKYKGTLTYGNEQMKLELNFRNSHGWESGWYWVDYSYDSDSSSSSGIDDWLASGSKVYSYAYEDGRKFEGETFDNGATIDLNFYTSSHKKKWTGKVTKQ